MSDRAKDTRAKDTRTLFEKMRDRANGRGTTESERKIAERWMVNHPEQAPAFKPPRPAFTGQYPPNQYGQTGFSRSRQPETDAEKRRRDEREEAAARREQRSRQGQPFDADAFEDQFRQGFEDGFTEEMRRRTGNPFDIHGYAKATPEAEAVRRKEEEQRRAERREHERELREEMRAARAAETQRQWNQYEEHKRQAAQQQAAEKATVASAEAAIKEARDAVKRAQPAYRIEYDEGGNPVRRRVW